jgi:hypothetical protein
VTKCVDNENAPRLAVQLAMSAEGQKRTCGHFYALAYRGRIESSITSRGNHAPGGCQAPENIALTRDDALAKARAARFRRIADHQRRNAPRITAGRR